MRLRWADAVVYALEGQAAGCELGRAMASNGSFDFIGLHSIVVDDGHDRRSCAGRSSGGHARWNDADAGYVVAECWKGHMVG